MRELSTLRMYARFILGLPGFLHRQVTIEEAQATIRTRLRDRDASFLRILRRAIFDHPRSPYLPLLKTAGYDYRDVANAVEARGLDATLEELRAGGVYVTFEEYKGRKPIIRGSQVLEVDEHAFDNPLTSKAIEGQTGGSTGAGTRVETDIENLYTTAHHLVIYRWIHGILRVPQAVWFGAPPDPTGVGVILRGGLWNGFAERWFTPVTRAHLKPALRFRLATHYIVWMSRLCGRPFPSPEPLPLDQAITLAIWAADSVRTHGRCEVNTLMSLAVRICLAATEAGIDLTGTTFVGGGEPLTHAKERAITRAGARIVPLYIGGDTGPIGLPCANPREPNEHHLLEDALAIIQHPREVEGTGTSVDAFYFTALRAASPKVLLNVESDDYGIIDERRCGCPLEELGYGRHVRRIRSFSKLTGEGVSLVGSDMVTVLEEVLPQRFGGTAQDFQLVEDEDESGLTRLNLLVHPRLEIPCESAVLETVMEALDRLGDDAGLARAQWQQAGTLQVRREEPAWTDRGKFLPIRVSGLGDPGASVEGSRVAHDGTASARADTPLTAADESREPKGGRTP